MGCMFSQFVMRKENCWKHSRAKPVELTEITDDTQQRMNKSIEMTNSLPLGEVLNSYRQRAIMTDVVLVCGGEYFPAHKLILSATSNYFRTMFSSELDKNTIKLPSITAKEMGIVLSFLYTRKFDVAGCHQVLKTLADAAHFLQVNELFQSCYKKLFESLNCNNCLEMFNLAFEYNDAETITQTITFLVQHFEEVTDGEEFLRLNHSQMQTIYQHPDIYNISMDIVIDGLFRWSEVEESRETALLQILTTFDLKLMSTDFLTETLRERSLVKKNHHILTLLTAEATSRMLSLCSKQLKIMNEPKLLVFGYAAGCEHVVRTYNTKRNQWSLLKTLPFHVFNDAAAASFDGHIYFSGGFETKNKKVSDEILRYCPSRNTVASVGKLAESVKCAGSGVLNEYIYVVNGENENSERVRTVQRYNPVAGVCERRAHTNKSHWKTNVLAFDKYLLVVGSDIGDNSVERYNPTCDSWTLITTIPGKIMGPSAALYKEKLFVVPVVSKYEFQIYDFHADKWEQKQFEGTPSLILALYSTSFEGNYIILALDATIDAYILDVESEIWSRKPNQNDTGSFDICNSLIVA